MSIRVGINGFGRIGRLVFKAARNSNLEIVGINDITDASTLAHLLKYDSIHGKYPGEVSYDGEFMVVEGKKVKVTAEKDPTKLPWKELGVQVVVESTGIMKGKADASKHIAAGANKVLISAPAKEHDGTFVIGVNDKDYDKRKHDVISIGSCTTNGLAPIVKVLLDNFGIERGFMTTIPTSTGAAKAIAEVIPAMKGKMDGVAIRVPTPDASLVDLAVLLSREATKEEINGAMKKAAEGPLKGILQYCTDPIVSVDIIGNSHSSIFDAELTMAKGNFAKVFSWYDNEWGFSCRMVQMIEKMV